jgi:hypothetical protein
LLRRPAQEDNKSRGARHGQEEVRDRSYLRGEPLFRQTLRRDGAKGGPFSEKESGKRPMIDEQGRPLRQADLSTLQRYVELGHIVSVRTITRGTQDARDLSVGNLPAIGSTPVTDPGGLRSLRIQDVPLLRAQPRHAPPAAIKERTGRPRSAPFEGAYGQAGHPQPGRSASVARLPSLCPPANLARRDARTPARVSPVIEDGATEAARTNSGRRPRSCRAP